MSRPKPHLDRDHVDELHHLLGTIEDWLLHCCDDTRDDLGRFLAGLGWPGTPERAAARACQVFCVRSCS